MKTTVYLTLDDYHWLKLEAMNISDVFDLDSFMIIIVFKEMISDKPVHHLSKLFVYK